MITKMKFRIESETPYSAPRLITRLTIDGHLVFEDIQERETTFDQYDIDRAAQAMKSKFAAALGKLMQKDPDDGLVFMVAGWDRGHIPPRRMIYSLSGQWTRELDRVRHMTRADAQEFCALHPSNDVRRVCDFETVMQEEWDSE